MLQFLARLLADLGQDAVEVALRVSGVAFGAGDEAPQPRMVRDRGVMFGEEPANLDADPDATVSLEIRIRFLGSAMIRF